MPIKSIERLLFDSFNTGLSTYAPVFYDQADDKIKPPYIVWSLVDNILDGIYLASSGQARIRVDIYTDNKFDRSDIRNSCGEWLRRFRKTIEQVDFFVDTTTEISFRRLDDPFYRGTVDAIIKWRF